jgi:sugar (glycoside-pentoside-hexuronide) transporter
MNDPARPGPQPGEASPRPDPAIAVRVKVGYALGDHTINVQLATVSLFFLFFLTEVVGLPPSLAGLVLLVGRGVDAFTDPLMGRLSDRTRWRWGRRRPYFLIGALPFGASFVLLWSPVDLGGGPAAVFLVYVAFYVLNTLFSTLLAVPYMALLPEMALDYHERTSMNTFRTAGVVLAILLAAVGMPWLVAQFGGGANGYAGAGLVLGIWVALPWLVVFGVSWERPGFRRPSAAGFVASLRRLAEHRSYRLLASLFLTARISVDVAGAMLIFYFTYWVGRPEDFSLAMALMLGGVIVSLPFWMRLARRADKRSVFIAGALWWSAMLVGIFFYDPAQPRWIVLALAGLSGIGYGVADLMPWAMLGDVIDEDELESRERRDGVYAGFFTFVRKLGGAAGVAVAGIVLDAAGFMRGAPAQEGSALLAIRALATLGPIAFLLGACVLALRYPLTRARHTEIRRGLAARSGETA